MPNSEKWQRPKLEYLVISTKLKKLNDFIYFFTYLLLFARGGKYSPVRIHQKYLTIYTTSTKFKFFERELETVNKSISKTVETFVMFLYLRNGKYVNNFIWLFLFDENYSNNNMFLFTIFSTNFKVFKKDTLFAINWKCCLRVGKNNKNILLY